MEKRTFFGLIACFFAVSLALQTAVQTTEPFCNKEDGTCPDGTTKSEDLTTVDPYDVIKNFLPSEISTRPTHNESEKKLLVFFEYVIYVCILSGIAYLIMKCYPLFGTCPEVSSSSRPNETGNQGEDISIGFSEREPLRSLQQETDEQGGNDGSIGSPSNEISIREGTGTSESIELPSIPLSTSSDDLDENSLPRYESEETVM